MSICFFHFCQLWKRKAEKTKEANAQRIRTSAGGSLLPPLTKGGGPPRRWWDHAPQIPRGGLFFGAGIGQDTCAMANAGAYAPLGRRRFTQFSPRGHLRRMLPPPQAVPLLIDLRELHVNYVHIRYTSRCLGGKREPPSGFFFYISFAQQENSS
jgi:hypothetical protein